MKTFLTLCALLFAANVAADPGKPAEACEKQHAQCMKQCDKEKTAWFFKGEAYDSCAAKCEARNESCAATGTGDGMPADAEKRRGHRGQHDAARGGAEDQPEAGASDDTEMDANAEADAEAGTDDGMSTEEDAGADEATDDADAERAGSGNGGGGGKGKGKGKGDNG